MDQPLVYVGPTVWMASDNDRWLVVALSRGWYYTWFDGKEYWDTRDQATDCSPTPRSGLRHECDALIFEVV